MIILLLFLILISVFILTKSLWDTKSRFALVFANESGKVDLVVVDPHVKTITTISIPPSTQVEVAHQLGQWKLESIYRLGKQEDLDGQLLADTITKSLKLPVDAWAHQKTKSLPF